MWRCIGLAVMLLLALTGSGQGNDEAALVTQLEQVEGYLGDQQPESSRYPNAEIYDQTTTRFYSSWWVKVQPRQMLVVDVYSGDFPPAASLHDQLGDLLVRGRIQEEVWNPGLGAYVKRLRLEYTADEASETLLSLTTQDISQGRFTIVWSIWQDQSAASGGTQGGGSVSACECQDPASGRWYHHPFQTLGVCVPAEATRWCN